jgi:hypothetical protein
MRLVALGARLGRPPVAYRGESTAPPAPPLTPPAPPCLPPLPRSGCSDVWEFLRAGSEVYELRPATEPPPGGSAGRWAAAAWAASVLWGEGREPPAVATQQAAGFGAPQPALGERIRGPYPEASRASRLRPGASQDSGPRRRRARRRRRPACDHARQPGPRRAERHADHGQGGRGHHAVGRVWRSRHGRQHAEGERSAWRGRIAGLWVVGLQVGAQRERSRAGVWVRLTRTLKPSPYIKRERSRAGVWVRPGLPRDAASAAPCVTASCVPGLPGRPPPASARRSL